MDPVDAILELLVADILLSRLVFVVCKIGETLRKVYIFNIS
jgi:hypothetical protein